MMMIPSGHAGARQMNGNRDSQVVSSQDCNEEDFLNGPVDD